MALRDPSLVIDSILAVDGVPEDMRRALGAIRKEQFYRPPEQRMEAFWQIQDVLSIHVPEPPEETWHVGVVAAWMGLTEDQVVARFGGPQAAKAAAG